VDVDGDGVADEVVIDISKKPEAEKPEEKTNA
jgi:hypothetical protein